jgi:hypothetical protein
VESESDLMSETPEEFRQRVDRIDSKFYEDFQKGGGPFGDRGFEYEKLAIDYSHKGFQTLTYLNGGALVAIPTAMAFFKADVAKLDILITAGAFILGLLCVVIAEVCAFFTMAKRAEGQEEFRWEQFHRVAGLMYPRETPTNKDNFAKADNRRKVGSRKLRISDIWRWIGLGFFAGSLIAFVAGCGLGALAVMAAKEKVETLQR